MAGKVGVALSGVREGLLDRGPGCGDCRAFSHFTLLPPQLPFLRDSAGSMWGVLWCIFRNGYYARGSEELPEW